MQSGFLKLKVKQVIKQRNFLIDLQFTQIYKFYHKVLVNPHS